LGKTTYGSLLGLDDGLIWGEGFANEFDEGFFRGVSYDLVNSIDVGHLRFSKNI
jgi:hypothetical protein